LEQNSTRVLFQNTGKSVHLLVEKVATAACFAVTCEMPCQIALIPYGLHRRQQAQFVSTSDGQAVL
jgi:hypothetical protein